MANASGAATPSLGSALPPVGKTLCLVLNEGLAGEKEQYIRVTDVTVTETVLVDGTLSDGSDQTYTRWIVSLSLSDALRRGGGEKGE